MDAWLNRSQANILLGREAEADADRERGEHLMQAASTQEQEVNGGSVYHRGRIGTVTFIFGAAFLNLTLDWNLWQTVLGAIALMLFAEGIYFVFVKIRGL